LKLSLLLPLHLRPKLQRQLLQKHLRLTTAAAPKRKLLAQRAKSARSPWLTAAPKQKLTVQTALSARSLWLTAARKQKLMAKTARNAKSLQPN
jgi:hypothetical protein